MDPDSHDDEAILEAFFSHAFTVDDPESQLSNITVERQQFTKTEKTALSNPEAVVSEYRRAPDRCEFCNDVADDSGAGASNLPSFETMIERSSGDGYTGQYATSHEVGTCPECGGDGEVACADCSDGEVKCPGCAGTGEQSELIAEECPTCSGRGYTDANPCGVCNQSGTVVVDRQCSRCDGSGHNAQKERCSACEGAGKRDTACPHCTGGTITGQCGTCTGAGTVQTTKSCPECRRGKTKEERQCPKCAGTETVDGDRCSNCRGSGIIEETTTCGFCNGDGEITDQSPCGDCNGSGTVRRNCAECDGTGQLENATDCDTCGGNGRLGGTCENCGGTGSYTREETCSACDGRGEQHTECPECGGDETIDVEHTWTCERCDGAEIVACSVCGGTTHVECPTCHGAGDVHRGEMKTVQLERQEPNTSYRPREIPGPMDNLSWELIENETTTETDDDRLDDVFKLRKQTYEVMLPHVTYDYRGETYEAFVTDAGVRYNDAPTLRSYDGHESAASLSKGTIFVFLLIVVALIWFLL